MDRLEELKKKNPNLKFYNINSEEFKAYGKTLHLSTFNDALDYLNLNTEIPKDGNTYIAHDDLMQKSIKDHSIYNTVFGEVEIQYGYVNGQNTKMNSLEYHKSSEINIAATPLVLLLGKVYDIVDKHYDVNNLIAFYVPENTAFEVYPNTLHFSPCKVLDSGFKCGVILPKGTNVEFSKVKNPIYDEDFYLLKTNKWLLNHNENKRFADLGAYDGLVGKNIEIKY